MADTIFWCMWENVCKGKEREEKEERVEGKKVK